jgi:hypothetical protein
VSACVPAHGYTEIRLATPVSSTIPGDLATVAQSLLTRRGGVFFGETALASEIGGVCAPNAPKHPSSRARSSVRHRRR